VVLTHMFPVVNAMVKETINDRTAAMGVGWGQCEQWEQYGQCRRARHTAGFRVFGAQRLINLNPRDDAPTHKGRYSPAGETAGA
jgi:hypothetical protein